MVLPLDGARLAISPYLQSLCFLSFWCTDTTVVLIVLCNSWKKTNLRLSQNIEDTFLCPLIFHMLLEELLEVQQYILTPQFSNFKMTEVVKAVASLIIHVSHGILYSSNHFFSCVVLSFHLKPFIIHVGLRSSALLALLSSNESASDSELCPVSLESSQELSTATDTSSLPGSTAAICSPSSPSYKVGNRRYFMWKCEE